MSLERVELLNEFSIVEQLLFTELKKMLLVNHSNGMCKVEFIQPSNWLYSVPNLLVIQHLVTLYLGGFDVRVVSKIE